MTILLLDDHTLYRESLAHTLSTKVENLNILQASNGAEAKSQLTICTVDLLMLDLNLGKDSGLQILLELRSIQPTLKTLVVSMHSEAVMVNRVLEAGVQGFVTKSASMDELLGAVGALLEGRTWFEGSIQNAIVSPERSGSAEILHRYRNLTRREQEVFRKLAEGLDVYAIASVLTISPKTVENNRSALYQKLGIGDRYELVALAKRLGLVF